MLLKETIIKMLYDLNLPASEYWVTSGAGLVLHGVKETTRDIDLGVTKDLAEPFVQAGCPFPTADDEMKIIQLNDSVELLENWLVDEITFLDGFPAGTLESIRKQKSRLGRKKDWDDIRLIDEYRNRTSKN